MKKRLQKKNTEIYNQNKGPKKRPQAKNENREKASEMTEDDFFDDCAICRGMKKAKAEGRELGMEELKGLFDKQNKKNIAN